ncbi:hypothetical protein MMC22_010913 [Lobaria immixta]|nr:hypothetical protein [Lobaria immixta]
MNATENESGTGQNLSGFYAYKNTFDEDSVWLDIPKNGQSKFTFVNVSDPFAETPSPELDGKVSTPGQSPCVQQQQQEWETRNDLQDVSARLSPLGLETLSTAALDKFPHVNMIPRVLSYEEETDSTSMRLPTPGVENVTAAMSSTPLITPVDLNIILSSSPAGNPAADPSLQSAPRARSDVFSRHSNRSPRFTSKPRSEVIPETKPEIAFLLRHFSETSGQWMDLFDLDSYFSSYVPIKALSNPLIKCAVCAYAAKHLSRVKDSKAVIASFWTQQAGVETWSSDVPVDWALEGAKWYDKAISLLVEALQQEKDDTPSEPGVVECAWKESGSADGSRSGPSAKATSHHSRLSSDELLTATAILSVYEFLDASGAAWARHLNGTKSLLDITEVGLMPFEMPMTSGSFHSPSLPKELSRARKAIFWNFARQDALAAFINECQTRLDTEDIQMWREAGLSIDDDGFVLRCNTIANKEMVMEADMICNALIWIMSKLVNFIAAGEGFQPVPGYRPFMEQDDEPLKIGVSQQKLLERWTDIKHLLKTWFDGLPDIFRPCARIEPSAHDEDAYNHIQPLYVAGQCLTDPRERRVILDLLRNIEIDLGWATEYRVEQLLKEWGWENSEVSHEP